MAVGTLGFGMRSLGGHGGFGRGCGPCVAFLHGGLGLVGEVVLWDLREMGKGEGGKCVVGI